MTDFNTILEQFDNLAGFGGDTPVMSTNPPGQTATPPVTNTSLAGDILGGVFSFTTRIVAIILGLILIAGSIYLFKGGDIIETVKSGAKAAAVA